jgi:hypothetical protein
MRENEAQMDRLLPRENESSRDVLEGSIAGLPFEESTSVNFDDDWLAEIDPAPRRGATLSI